MLLAAAAAVHASSLVHPITAPESTDFAVFVLNARGWLSGVPYPPGSTDPNLPHVILCFVPFALMPLSIALPVWLVISYAAAAAALGQIARHLPERPSAALGLTGIAMLAASPPVLIVTATGNMIFPLWWLMTLAWGLARSGRSIASAALMGLLMSIKPFLSLWLPFYVLRRDWTSAVVASGDAAATLLLSVLVTGVDTWRAWIEVLGRLEWYDSRYNVSVFGTLARAWQPSVVLWAVACLIVCVSAAVQIRRDAGVDRAWAILGLVSMLLAPLSWRYYLLFALGPLTALVMSGALRPLSVGLLLSFAFTAVPLITATEWWLQATAGSVMFWLLLATWLTVGSRSSARAMP